MADSIFLTLGSPIKDHLAPSMLGPAGAKVTATSTAGSPAAILTSGTTKTLTAMHSTLGVGTTTAAVTTGLFFSLLSVTATVAVAYVTYRGVKALLD